MKDTYKSPFTCIYVLKSHAVFLTSTVADMTLPGITEEDELMFNE